MIIIVGLMVAFLLVLVFSNRQTRACRWREDRRADAHGQRRYVCMACGAETFAAPGQPPVRCHRNGGE